MKFALFIIRDNFVVGDYVYSLYAYLSVCATDNSKKL